MRYSTLIGQKSMPKASYKHGLFAIPYTNIMGCDYCKLKPKPKTFVFNIVGITVGLGNGFDF
jgi:hypothetical protein